MEYSLPAHCYLLKKKYRACPFLKPLKSVTNDVPLMPENSEIELDDLIIENNVDLLLRYTRAQGWPDPDYTMFLRTPKHCIPVYCATVKVIKGDHTSMKYNGYPQEDVNQNIAKGYAARKALEDIKRQEKVKANIISSDKNIICDRISNIVAKAFNGMFAKNLEELYIEKFNECLPTNWIDTISTCPTLSVEFTPNSTIILPRDPNVQLITHSQSELTCDPPSLSMDQLADDDLNVYITHATATTSVWFRIIGDKFSENYCDLLTNMDSYYSSTGGQEQALTIEVGHYYAAHTVESWLRVCVYEVRDESQTVAAWLIDHGDKEIFPFSSIYRLAPQFCELPKQAISCTLDGLENVGNDEIACEVVSSSEYLIGKTLIAKIKHKEEGFLKVVLYDTSGDDDINVNEQIQDSIIFAKANPVIPNVGNAKEVFIGDISKKGEVFIQIPGPAYERIVEMLDTLTTEQISEHKLTSFKQVKQNKIYLAKYSKDNNWYRAVVTAPPSVQQNKIAVRFIDFGNAETVGISDIASVENLPPLLNKLPAQAVKVALHNLPIETLTNTDVAKLHSLLLDEEKVVLIKTTNLDCDPPVVEIFYKNEADNSALVSVNTTIELQRSIFSKEEKKTDLSGFGNSQTSGNKPIEHNLTRPDLSEEFQAVLICLAANPGNFVFQPVKYGRDFRVLRGQMCAYYEAAELPEISKDQIVVGQLYAGYYDDNRWYRMVVTGTMYGSKVPLRLCDYGDMVCINISNLRQLMPEFLTFPFMAVKGKLAEVEPIHGDWSVEDCIRFQQLVVDKPLAAFVKNIKDSADPMEMVVSLKLFDTYSSDKDENIAETLVIENRAIYKRD